MSFMRQHLESISVSKLDSADIWQEWKPALACQSLTDESRLGPDGGLDGEQGLTARRDGQSFRGVDLPC